MRLVAGVVLAVLLAGCLAPAQPAQPSPSPSPSAAPKPRQIFVQEGNPPPCAQVMRDEQTFPFQVTSEYDQVEVVFHVSGLGDAGWSLYGPEGTLLHERSYDPQNQPCTESHDHTGAGDVVASRPGPHRLVVRNLGIVSWHLAVNEKSSNATAPTHH